MAKPTDERIAAAMGPRARIADLVELINDMRAEVVATNEEAARLEAVSIAVTTEEDAADAAADEATKLRRRATRLDAKVGTVDERRVEMVEAAAAKARAAHRKAVIDRRDQLVDDLREQWPGIVDQVVGLLQRIADSDEELAKLLGNLPSAEALARGCAGNFYDIGPISRLIDIRVPNLDASTHQAGYYPAWPLHARDSSPATA